MLLEASGDHRGSGRMPGAVVFHRGIQPGREDAEVYWRFHVGQTQLRAIFKEALCCRQCEENEGRVCL